MPSGVGYTNQVDPVGLNQDIIKRTTNKGQTLGQALGDKPGRVGTTDKRARRDVTFPKGSLGERL